MRLKMVKDDIKSYNRLVWLDIGTQYSLSNCKVGMGRLEKY